MKKIGKQIVLWGIGGMMYILLELLWRGYSHWTMFILGGICFVILGELNEVIPWEMPLWKQALIGTVVVTVLELATGYIVNIRLGWRIWDYGSQPGNLWGQICPLYTLLWIPVSITGIVLDDWLRYWIFKEEKPKYKLL